MNAEFASFLKIERMLVLAVGLVFLQSTPFAASLRAADYDVVGVLAIAVEPEVSEQLGLTENQLVQLQDLIAEKEAELLTSASELRNLPPQERNNRLAEFRYLAENAGLALLSSQQRAKLEQMRLKRYGLGVLADPVVARRLQISPDQAAAIQQSLGPGAATVGETVNGGSARDAAIVQVLNESQRQALRAMLLGELPLGSTPPSSDTVERPVTQGEPAANVGIPDELEVASVAPAVPVASVPEDEMLPEPPSPSAAPVVASSQPKGDGGAAAEPTSPGPVTQNSDMIAPNGGAGTLVTMESEQEKGDQPQPKPDQQENAVTPQAGQTALIEAEAKPEGVSQQEQPGSQSEAAPAEEKSPSPVAAGNSEEQPMGELTEEPAKVGVAAPSGIDASAQPSVGEQKAQQDVQLQPAPAGTTIQDQKPQEVKVETPTAAEPKPIGSTGDMKSVSLATPSGIAPGDAPVTSSQPTDGGLAKGESVSTAQIPQLPPADVKLRFNFRYQPWKEVLDWLAQQAGLSLVMESPPPGSFNYVDDHEFTATEAIDLLNSVLLTKGYVLVRRERMLMLFNVEDGVPPNLVDTVSPEDLEKRGDYEMVSCLFQLRRMTPEEAEQEVKKLLGPQGSVVVLAKAKQLFVTETAGRLKTIRRMLDAIENPSTNDMVRTFRVNPATVDQVLSIVRQMFQISPDQTANADGTLRFAVDPGASRLLVSGSPEMLDRFSQLLQALDPSATDGTSGLESTPQLEVYPITSADPEMVLQVFQTLLAGMPDVRLAIDPKTGALVAWARPAQHATIRATLEQLQGEVGQVEVIPLRVVDPQLAVLAISKLFGTTGDSASSNAPTVDADLSTRMLLVRGTKAQIDQIRQLLVKMGEPADASVAGNLSLMRTIPMDAGTAQAIINQMENLWPQVRPNRLQVIRSVVPSELDRASPETGQGEQLPSDDGRTERGVEARRIPLPEAMTSASRLVLGLKPQTSASSTSSGTTSGSSFTPQQSSPQQWPGQSPFFRPWGPGGSFSPGGRAWFFDRRSESDRHDSGRDGWRGSDRTTYSNQDTMLVVAAGDVSNEARSNWDNWPATRTRVAARLISEEKPRDEGETASEGNNAGTESPQAAGAAGVTVEEEAKSGEPGSALDSSPISAQPQEATQPAPQMESAQPPAPPPIIVAVTPEGLVVASQDPDALNQFENLVRRMASQDVSQYAGPELVVYYLKNSKAESVASILDQILGGGTLTSSGSSGGSLVGEIARAAFGNVGGGLVGSLLGIDTGSGSSTSASSLTSTSSRIQITPDVRLNALIVQAYPQDLQLIEEILRVLDQQESPQEVAVQPKTIIIPVKNTQAEEIAGILRSVYQDRLVTGASANRGPSPQEIIQLLRGSRGGGPGGGGRTQPQEEVQRMSIGVDARTNSLIISAPERLLSEVRQLVEQLDQKAITESEETTQVVTLQRASPESVQAALSALLGTGVQIRGATTGSSPRITSSTQTSGTRQGSSSAGSRTQGRFGLPFGQMPFGGFRPTTQFRGSTFTRGSSSFSRRTGGR